MECATMPHEPICSPLQRGKYARPRCSRTRCREGRRDRYRPFTDDAVNKRRRRVSKTDRLRAFRMAVDQRSHDATSESAKTTQAAHRLAVLPLPTLISARGHAPLAAINPRQKSKLQRQCAPQTKSAPHAAPVLAFQSRINTFTDGILHLLFCRNLHLNPHSLQSLKHRNPPQRQE